MSLAAMSNRFPPVGVHPAKSMTVSMSASKHLNAVASTQPSVSIPTIVTFAMFSSESI